MDNLFDLKNSLFRRGTGPELRFLTQWAPIAIGKPLCNGLLRKEEELSLLFE
jgi:hypothetical protein